MENNESEINDRLVLIEYLKSKGLTVHGVISTSDLVWHQKQLASEFYEEFTRILDEQDINIKEDTEQKARELLSQERYAALRSFAGTLVGSAFADGKKSPSTRNESAVLVNTVGIIRSSTPSPYSSEKGELFEAFYKNKPAWISSIIVVDDAKPNIDAVERVASQHQEGPPVFTIHNREGEKVKLEKSTYNNLFKNIAVENLYQQLRSYHHTRSSLEDEFRHTFFCIGLGHSRTKKLEAVDALCDAIKNPSTAKPITDKQLAALRNKDLGDIVRSFVKEGGANIILGSSKPITTVRAFIKSINENLPHANEANMAFD
jgi:hypothetical protein